MAKTLNYRDLNTMKGLYYIGNVFCITPIYNFTSGKTVRSATHLIYSLLVLIAIPTFTGLAAFYRAKVVYPALNTTTVVVDMIANCLLGLANFIIVLKLCVWKFKEFSDFIESIAIYDKKSNISSYRGDRKNYNFYFELVFYHLIYASYCLSDGYVWIRKLGIRVFIHYIFRNFQFYHILAMSFLLYNFALILRDRFIHLNERLEQIIFFTSKSIIVREIGKKKGVHAWRESNGVKDVTKLYITLCEMVEKYNKSFGVIILLLAINLIVGLLQPINLALVYTSSGDKIGDQSFGFELAFLCMFWASIYVVMACVIATSCDQTMNRARETAFICYKLIQELSSYTDHQIIKEDLILLAQQVSNRPPCIEAAGFFTVNYKTLVSIVGSVTAYIVVLIQFKN